MSIHPIQTGSGTRYVVRYRSPDGRSREKRFGRKGDAVRFETEIKDAMYRGAYVDPRAGRTTFKELADQWRSTAMHGAGTAVAVESRLRVHVHPHIGDRPIASIRPSDIQRVVKLGSQRLAGSTVNTTYSHIASVFKFAVADKVIATSPCIGIKLPPPATKRADPISADTARAITDAISPRFKALTLVAAATGLRQGELFGLTIDRIDRSKRQIIVDRQIQPIEGKPAFTCVKTLASHRVVPVPQSTIDVIDAHVATYGLGPDGLVFTGRTGKALRRSSFQKVWKPVSEKLGFAKGSGLHMLRHFHASMLIRAGASVKVVQARLGHASAMETLDTYGHLWEDDDDRTRDAVDEFLGHDTPPETTQPDSDTDCDEGGLGGAIA